jgi:hypothetical protein
MNITVSKSIKGFTFASRNASSCDGKAEVLFSYNLQTESRYPVVLTKFSLQNESGVAALKLPDGIALTPDMLRTLADVFADISDILEADAERLPLAIEGATGSKSVTVTVE